MHTRAFKYGRFLLPVSLCLGVVLTGCLTEVAPDEVGFEPVLVVESFPQPGHAVTLCLTKTRPLWDPASLATIRGAPTDSFQVWDAQPLLVTGAEVDLVVNETTQHELREDSAGYYSLSLDQYQPAPEDRLVLTIATDGMAVRAATVIPRPAANLSFELETTPVEEEVQRLPPGQDRPDTLYFYILTQRVEAGVTLLDSPGQKDFYFLDLDEKINLDPLEPGEIRLLCRDAQPDGVSEYGLINDVEQQGEQLRIRDEMALRVSLDSQRYPQPEDRIVSCELGARIVQYGPQYDRFLAIDYDPVTGESGSNVEGGLGLFTGVVVRDTTIHLTLQATE